MIQQQQFRQETWQPFKQEQHQDLFSDSGSKSSTTTTEQQVGVQGGLGVGAGANLAGANINISDKDTVEHALSSVESISTKALDVGTSAVSGSQQGFIEALHTLQQGMANADALVAGAVAGNQAIAAQAAPVSEGNQQAAILDSQKKIATAALVVIGVLGAGYIYTHSN